MWKGYDKEGGAAHGYTGPNGRDEDVPMVENSSDYGHYYYIVGKGPEEIHFDEEITLF